MTNIEALKAEIEPFSLSENALKLDLMNAELLPESVYSPVNAKQLGIATCYALSRCSVVSSESEGGFSQSYKDIQKRINAIVSKHSLDASMFILESGQKIENKSSLW